LVLSPVVDVVELVGDAMTDPVHREPDGLRDVQGVGREHQFDAFYSDERWTDRPGRQPDHAALRREMRLARRRGYSLNNGRTEIGVTAIGRVVLGAAGRAEAAVSISLPTARYSRTTLPKLVAATTADIERDLVAAIAADG
jgi:DNA-binding IclR family transcriptional regulator